MDMDKNTADRWVTIAAVIVAAVYAYRRLTETASGPTSVKKLAGIGSPVPLGGFVTAWGFTFFVVSIMAEASPGLGGGFAILIATSDLLTNMPAITADVGKRIGSTAAGSTTSLAGATTSLTATGQTTTLAGAQATGVPKGVLGVGGTVATGVAGVSSGLDPLLGATG